MIAIRLPKRERGKAWRAMIAIGPIRLVAPDPIYEVLPAHLDLMRSLGFSFEIVKNGAGLTKRERNGTAN